ncbi:MAG: VOC family protein [Marivibrio sp.]|uniref:VOC family protein n=1 Tax=Marivibrio sp. TaxID=2039719 RepID=UPI0032EB4FC1
MTAPNAGGPPPTVLPGEAVRDADAAPDLAPKRGVDHLVLAVADLETAGAAYERLGFTVTPRAEHSWGTANRLVQFAHRSFLEILTVAHPDRIPDHGDRRFSFGRFNQDYLARREGFGMLVFDSADARADRDEFAEKGLADLEPFDFERQATLPSGETVRVAFSLAFAPPPAERDGAAVFTCQQHAPEHFWKPDYQVHENGAREIVEVVMIADDPAGLRSYWEGVQGPEAVSAEDDGSLAIETARGAVLALTPEAYQTQYGEPPRPDAPEGPHFAAFRVGVRDLAATRDLLVERGVETRWAQAGLIVPSDSLFGVALAFAQL